MSAPLTLPLIAPSDQAVALEQLIEAQRQLVEMQRRQLDQLERGLSQAYNELDQVRQERDEARRQGEEARAELAAQLAQSRQRWERLPGWVRWWFDDRKKV